MDKAKDKHPDLVDKLAEGVRRLTSSDQWRRHLAFQGRFHRYSFSNVLLISAQCQGATRVAGFNAWRRLGRSVRKGEKAIWVLAPMVYKETGGDDGERAEVLRGFKWVPVFDVAQTEGQPLPSVCEHLEGDDPGGLYDALVGCARSIGFQVQDHHFDDATNGDCCHGERRIRVEATNAPAQRVKTLAHELAHALLHEHFDSRALAELEAESTAYVVCQALGIDSGDYSFGYVATWAGSGEQAVMAIRSCGERAQRTAAAILGSIGPASGEAGER